jgi:hypothetical protein
MARLNQIVAVEKGVKAKTFATISNAHQVTQKIPLLSGISRVYQPRDEEGERLPQEATRVQINVEQVLGEVSESLTKLFDVTATKDYANQKAAADVVVNGQVLIANVPVPYLLFLEKQLTDLYTFVKKLPILDPSDEWTHDENLDVWRTPVVQTTRTRKVPRNHVKAEATEKHPAQVEVYFEDQIVGTWNTTRFSGALPQSRVNDILTRVVALQEAVKFAREQANNAEAQQQHIGDSVFEYLFG